MSDITLLFDENFRAMKSSNVILERGACLARSTNQGILRGVRFNVIYPKDAIFHVEELCDRSAVRNLSQATIKVVLGNGREIPIFSGQELFLGSTPLFEDRIARRRSQILKIANEYVTLSEISILSLVSQDAVLRSLRHPESQMHKQYLDTILKTAAALSIATSGHGFYASQTGN